MAGPLEQVEQQGSVARGHQVPHVAQGLQQPVEHVEDPGPVLDAQIGPDGRIACGDAGHVPEPTGGQAQQGGVLEGGVGGQVHEGGRGQVRDVGHHGDQVVVAGRG